MDHNTGTGMLCPVQDAIRPRNGSEKTSAQKAVSSGVVFDYSHLQWTRLQSIALPNVSYEVHAKASTGTPWRYHI